MLLSGAASAQTVGELFASEATAHGPALLTGSGMVVQSGAQASAGTSPATLRLQRGGEVKICPRSSLTVNAVPGNQELMMAMNTSAVEINYPINNLADTLVTPDFKVMLAGPGIFHFALGVNNRGDTCIKSLRGNSSNLIVQEMLGSGIYQVKADESVLFSGGKLDGRAALETECGCPAPPPVLQAENEPEKPPKPVTKAAASEPEKSSVTAPLPQEQPGEAHVQVDAPLIFSGSVEPEAPEVPPASTVARVRFSTMPNVFLLQEKAEPPVLPQNKEKEEVSPNPPVTAKQDKPREKKGFFGKIKGLFSSLFKK
jgi:hypothetical protein